MTSENKHFNHTIIKGSRILITGASGFIGFALSKQLLKYGAEVYGVSRKIMSQDLDIHWQMGDLTDYDFVENIVKKIKPDYIIHLASLVTGSREIQYVFATFHNNLLSTLNLLNAIYYHNCKRLIIAGSSEEPNLDEKNHIPASPYASAKQFASAYARMFHTLYKIPVAIARIFMVYGPGQIDHDKLIPYVILNTLRGKSPKVSSGQRKIDWIYIDDVVDGLVSMIYAKGVDGDTIDLGSGELISIKEIVELTTNLIDPKISADFGAIEDRPMEQSRVANVKETYKKTGWKPRVNLQSGLSKTINYYKR